MEDYIKKMQIFVAGFLFGVMCDHEIEVLVWSLFVYLPTMVSSGSTPREGIEPWAKLVTGYLRNFFLHILDFYLFNMIN